MTGVGNYSHYIKWPLHLLMRFTCVCKHCTYMFVNLCLKQERVNVECNTRLQR